MRKDDFMEVYLDNASTTRLLPEVIDEVKYISENVYGNPSSLHSIGLEAERVVRNAREVIAKSLGVNTNEVYFTSGATESDNTAIFGSVYANLRRGNHIITSKIEHPAVLMCFEKLEKEGLDVTYLDVDKNGIIDMEQLKKSINDKTIFISVMTVNNELGSIQPISEIAKLKKKYNFILHTDAVQAYTKLPYNRFNMADLISISGHKVHALKGIGALVVKKGTKINPYMLGGGHESGFRSGTENVVGIASLAKAIADSGDYDRVRELRDILKEGVSTIPCAKINCYNDGNSAPHILSVSFVGKRGEVIMHALEEKGIYVSTGSACHSNRFGESHVLSAIGLSKEEIGGTIRFSLCDLTTREDIDYCVSELKKIIDKL